MYNGIKDWALKIPHTVRAAQNPFMRKCSKSRLPRRALGGTLPTFPIFALACLMPRPVLAQTGLVPLQVAYAGSMGSLMDGGVKPAVAKAIDADLQGRAQGSTGLANLIVAGSIRPDVFISVTPGPMRLVLRAEKTQKALPIARTEMVIAYSPKSQYASLLAKANDSGAKPWWQILETQGLRFGRTDPNTDPQGVTSSLRCSSRKIFISSLASPLKFSDL